MKNVLFHVGDIERKRQILSLCREMGISVKWLKKGDLCMTVGELAEMDRCWKRNMGMGDGNVPKGNLPEELPISELPDVMVFSGLDDKKLDEFLERYREAEITPIGLKAVVTPYNIAWSLGKLIRELRKEAMYDI